MKILQRMTALRSAMLLAWLGGLGAAHADTSTIVSRPELLGLETAPRAWLLKGQEALDSAAEIRLPLDWAGVSGADFSATAWRFRAWRGRRIVVRIEGGGEHPAGLLADLFPAETGPERRALLPAGRGPASGGLSYEPAADGDLILLVQPEPGWIGEYTVRVVQEPILLFPVEGADGRAVISVFGDGRDEGARRHEGIDIRAPRGTPVLAPAGARVRRVGTNPRGGNVISLWDRERNLHYYFAHLDTMEVEAGVQVEAGQRIGTVGNTGNAANGQPHLHFGIYDRPWGAIDPRAFILP